MASTRRTQSISVIQLREFETPKLRNLYIEFIGNPPPKNASREFIVGNLSWAIQAGQSTRNLAILRNKLLRQSDPEKAKAQPQYQPGMRLVREWHGITYEVTVTEEGYRWQDQSYRSLTAIARKITGAGWSGPRFFGLRSKKA